MADVRIEHTFACPVDVFWDKVLFNDDFNRKLFKEHLGFSHWEVVSKEDTASGMKRKIDVTPKTGDLPSALKKLVGDNFGYQEQGVYDRDKGVYTVDVIPSRLADKLKIRGEMRVEPVGDNKCKRVFNLSVTCKVFGVGGMVEKRIAEDTKASYDKSAPYTERFIADEKLGES